MKKTQRPSRNHATDTSRVSPRRHFLKSFVVGGAVIAGGILLTRKARAKRRNPPVHLRSGSFLEGKSGRWGHIRSERIVLEPSEQVFAVDRFASKPHWHFKGTREQAIDFLHSIGFSNAETARLPVSVWTPGSAGVVCRPPQDLVQELSPATRAKLYDVLNTVPENLRYFDDFIFLPEYVDSTLNQSGLPEEELRLFRRLLYQHGPVLMFSDLPLMLSRLSDDVVRARFLQVLVRRPGLQTTLTLKRTADIPALAKYWGRGGREDSVRSTLEAVRSSSADAEIDIAQLLPPLVRTRLQTFPSSLVPKEKTMNCHWTALNFFRDPQEERFLYADAVEQEMASNYVQIKSDPELGDLVLFRNSSHVIAHSATFIADDIIFTKNGEGISQPWALMRVEDTIACYTALMGKISVTLYRPRQLMT